MLFKVLFVIFVVGFKSIVSVSIHSHIHHRERVEDGAYSPKENDIHAKKTESELIHEVVVGNMH